MATLISETDVSLERRDLERRVVLTRSVGTDGFIVPPVRRSGLHLSGLLKYVARASRLVSRAAEVQDEEVPLRWALGHAWEEFAASLYPDMVWQPGEVEDPLVMNCDGLRSEYNAVTGEEDEYLGEAKEFVVCEFKHNRAKKYAGADLIKKKWLWMCQGMGYCIGYGAELVEWHVISTMEFPDPVYTKYLVRFSDEELDGMRNMIEINKAGAIAAGFAE